MSLNIITNPVSNFPETKLTNTSDLKEPVMQPLSPNKSVKVLVEPGTVHLPFVLPTVERSKLNLPVVDFRYYNSRPVYRGTTLPLTTHRKPRPLTVWHGLLFSFIIIMGIILGAFAGFGVYKLFQ